MGIFPSMYANAQLLAVWALLILIVGSLVHYVWRTNRPWGRQRPSKARPSKEAHDDLFENELIGYLEIDDKGTVQRVNRKECDLRGLSAKEILGNHVADLNSPGSK